MHRVTLPSPAWQLGPSEVFIFHVQVICRAVNAPSHLGEFQSCMLCECGVTGQGVICKCCWKIYCRGWCGKVFHNMMNLVPQAPAHFCPPNCGFFVLPFLGGSSTSNTPAYEWKPVAIAALVPEEGEQTRWCYCMCYVVVAHDDDDGPGEAKNPASSEAAGPQTALTHSQSHFCLRLQPVGHRVSEPLDIREDSV